MNFQKTRAGAKIRDTLGAIDATVPALRAFGAGPENKKMWLITDFGFFSVVAKPGDREAGMLTVRARVRGDLDALRARYLPTLGPIEHSKTNDYAFRAKASRGAVATAMALAIEQIGYQNFKSRVRESQGPAREAVLHDVWHALYRLQRP